ncbi:MAG: hypothetical protein E4H36_12400, partial [Spirochaetales bacterium]
MAGRIKIIRRLSLLIIAVCLGTLASCSNLLLDAVKQIAAEGAAEIAAANGAGNTVTYNGNGNTGGTVPADPARYEEGASVTVPDNTGNLTRTGYMFAGWNTQADGGGIAYTAGETFTMGTSDVILYAAWPVISYTVTYNGNGNTGGTVPADPGRYEEGASVVMPGNTGTLVKGGFYFAGWNTQADGGGTAYTAGQTLTMGAADITLYAKWSVYSIGDTGPAGGYIFYDKGVFSAGWRYLEAAPSDQIAGIAWGPNPSTTGITATGIGSGEANTAGLISFFGTGSTYAVQLCDGLSLGGYSDWFLPSKDELAAMYTNLYLNSKGGFASNYYWSSSEYDPN